MFATMITVRVSALAAGLAVGALAGAATASADPAPAPPAPAPAPPVPAEIVPAIGNVLAQTGDQPSGPLGLPDLSAYGPNLLLGQTAQPALPGTPAATVPDLGAFNPEYLLSQNSAPAAPGEGTPAAGLAPNDDIDGTGRIAFLRRIYDMYQAGALRGALLGQQPAAEFVGEPAPEPPG
jgi:hypothetical protein